MPINEYGKFGSLSTGIVVGGSGGVPPFAFGNALDFDGVNDYVSFGGSNNLAVTGSAWTVGVWTKMGGFPTGFPVILRLKSGVVNNPFTVLLSNNVSYVDLTFGSQTTFTRQKATIPTTFLNTWIYLAVSYNGLGASTASNFNFYVNGSIVSTTNSGAFGSNTDTSAIGSISANPYLGAQDEVAFWQSELTPTQVSNQYNGGSGNFADADVTPLVWFEMNGTSGDSTAVNNGSGGATYNGTLNNFDTSTCWVAH